MKFLFVQSLQKDSLITIITYLGVIQGLLLAIVIWNYPRKHKISNRILSLFLLSLVYLYFGPRMLDFIDSPVINFYYSFRTLAPILLVLYIHSLYKKVVLKKYLWYLLIIPLDTLVLYLISRLKLTAASNSFNPEIISQSWFLIIYLFFTYIIFQEYGHYKDKVLQNFSSKRKIGLKWVNQLFFGFIIIVTLDFILSLLAVSYSNVDAKSTTLISTIAFTIFIYFITVKGKLSSEIYQLRNFDDIPELESQNHANTICELKENKELIFLSNMIIKCIEENKLYKELGLTVNDIAEKLDTHPYLVSQAINVCLGKNFFELINGYRVEEAKRLLMDESLNYLSMVGIGFEAGFNSKTAFNTSFKKFTGMTPSQFKKSALIKIS